MACRLALVLAVVASISVVTGHKGKCCNRAAKLKRKKIVLKQALSECEAAAECPPQKTEGECKSEFALYTQKELDVAVAEAMPTCDYASGEVFDGSSCITPDAAEAPAAEAVEDISPDSSSSDSSSDSSSECPSPVLVTEYGTYVDAESLCDNDEGATWNADTMKCEATTPACAANEYRKPDSDSCVAVEACPTCCPEGEYLKPGTTDTCVEVFALRSLFRTCMGCWQPPALTGFWTCEGCLDGDQG